MRENAAASSYCCSFGLLTGTVCGVKEDWFRKLLKELE
jgi:hypothetical protein